MYKKVLDPQADKETEKYSNPIPTREYILSLLREAGNGLTRQKISTLLRLENPDQQEALRRRLRAMCRDGQLIWSHKKGYHLTKDAMPLKGTVIGNKESFGFVTPEDGSPDLFLSAYQMRQVFPNDLVLVRVIGEVRKGRREAVIIEILERNTKRIIGYYDHEKENKRLVIRPLHPRIHHAIHIDSGTQANAQAGKVVLIEITQQPDLNHPPKGGIVKELGNKSTAGIESLIAIHTCQLPHKWPEAVTHEIACLKKPASLNNHIPRVDLRHLPFVTIDGEDSKDFDDAVYCEPRKKKWRLLVAIADVSHYVKPGTAIDKEASLRGNSVYLPHQVVTMLPEALSNDLCSIKPNIERFCLVCEMKISQQGQLKSYEFYPAIIRSQARLTYTTVTQYLTNDHYPESQWELAEPLQNLHAVYEGLFKAKQKRGAIDINVPESQTLLDVQGKLNNIQRQPRTIAHRIIEECMLVANVAAAQFLLKHKVPSLFRVHESPPPAKLNDFKSLINSLGIQFGSWFYRTPRPIDFAKLINKIRTHPDNQLIQSMLLRTMSQAIYSSTNKGHFGLGYPEYTHFTSPIRRYPDLIVHRAIYHLLNFQQENKVFDYETKQLESIGQHCSMTERRADEATRQVVNALKSQLMQAHLGESFTGKITHVTGFGFFVELKANLIEGLVHINSMKDDHYLFEAKKMLLRGERQGKSYRLGDTVRIQVIHVNLDTNMIDFKLLG